jgi:hypothetical protein
MKRNPCKKVRPSPETALASVNRPWLIREVQAYYKKRHEKAKKPWRPPPRLSDKLGGDT